jgi:hypothetical protein
MDRIVVLLCGAAIAAGLAAAIATWLRPELSSFLRAAPSRTIPAAARDPLPQQATQSRRTPTYVTGADNVRHDVEDLARLASPMAALAPAAVAATEPEARAASPEMDAIE